MVGAAQNGKQALQIIENIEEIDLLILDLDMPEMDGWDTIRQIKKKNLNIKILVYAGRSARTNNASFEIMKMGAHDFVMKPDGYVKNLEEGIQSIIDTLVPKVIQFDPSSTSGPIVEKQSAPNSSFEKINLETFLPEIIVIGCSTGGPLTLQAILKNLPTLTIPILLVQHIPDNFTSHLAKLINEISGHETRIARDEEIISNGKIYVAPGGMHMEISQSNKARCIKTTKSPKRNSVRPSVDQLFESAAEIYGQGVMGFVLTGMGRDGLAGSRAIKRHGGAVMIQDKETSTIWGMPGSVFESGAYDAIGTVGECRKNIVSFLNRAREIG